MPREREPEDRAAARLAPGLEPAAVQPGILQRDREPEPGPAGVPGSGRISTPEPVEHEMLLPRCEADAEVTDRHRHGIAISSSGDNDVAALAMLNGIAQEIPQDPLHTPPVHLAHTRLSRQPELDSRAALLGELLRHIGRLTHHVAD